MVSHCKELNTCPLSSTSGALCCLSSGEGWWCGSSFVEGAVAEHGVEDVGAASSEGDEGLVVAFALGSFAVVVGA